jgi:hypothetical protein
MPPGPTSDTRGDKAQKNGSGDGVGDLNSDQTGAVRRRVLLRGSRLPIQNDRNSRHKLVKEVEVAGIPCQYAGTDIPPLKVDERIVEVFPLMTRTLRRTAETKQLARNCSTFSQGRNKALSDARLVPVICPTCQMVSLASPVPATGRLLCMGLFSIFLVGSGTGSALERRQAALTGSNSVSERMMRSGLTVVSAGRPSPWASIQIA